jgi:plasmid stabilization system protein ParE
MRTPKYRPAARADISNLLKTSSRMFGPRARRSYKALIDRALNTLCENPQSAGVQRLEDIPGYNVFHLRHARERGVAPKQARHIIVFTYDEDTLTILRVLHDSMDITQRVSNDDDQSRG